MLGHRILITLNKQSRLHGLTGHALRRSEHPGHPGRCVPVGVRSHRDLDQCIRQQPIGIRIPDARPHGDGRLSVNVEVVGDGDLVEDAAVGRDVTGLPGNVEVAPCADYRDAARVHRLRAHDDVRDLRVRWRQMCFYGEGEEWSGSYVGHVGSVFAVGVGGESG